MLRNHTIVSAFALACGLLVSSANADDFGSGLSLGSSSGFSGLSGSGFTGLSDTPSSASPTTELPTFTLSALAQEEGGEEKDDKPGSYAAFKLGVYEFTGSVMHDLDTSFYTELVFGRNLIGRLLSIEANIGLIYNDDEAGGEDFEAIGIPFFVNAKLALPILFLERMPASGSADST